MTIPFNEYGVRIATEEDYPRVIDILTQSFRTDPQMNWMLNTPNHPDALEKAMELYLKMIDENTVVTITNEQNGVALWETSKEFSFSFRTIPMILDFMISSGIKTLTRGYEDKELSAAHRPDSEHYYLSMLAVVPQAQGLGVASRLMSPVLNSCKQEKIPVHLETGNPRNVDIYKKKGFVLNDTIENESITRYYMNTEV